MPNGGTEKEIIDVSHLTTELEESPEEISQDSLAKISGYAKEYQTLQAELKDLEEKCKAKKKEVTKYGQELIPESMLAIGMTAFQLASGEMVKFKEEVSCSVKDYDMLYDFLAERGDDGLMKINLEIGKVPKEILAMIVKTINEKFDILATTKLFIHPMTLRSYIKKLCGVGGDEAGDLPLAELDEGMVGTFTFYKTTVK